MDPVQLPFIHELALFLACAGIVVPLFRRLRVSPVLGFLAIGIVIGPLGLGRVVPPDSNCATVAAVDGAGRLLYPELSRFAFGRLVRFTP